MPRNAKTLTVFYCRVDLENGRITAEEKFVSKYFKLVYRIRKKRADRNYFVEKADCVSIQCLMKLYEFGQDCNSKVQICNHPSNRQIVKLWFCEKFSLICINIAYVTRDKLRELPFCFLCTGEKRTASLLTF